MKRAKIERPDWYMQDLIIKIFNRRLVLGEDADGVEYYLEMPSWDCGWYWGFGYIESRNSHQHADGEFESTSNRSYDKNIFTGDFLVKKEFDEKTGWELRELMEMFYMFRRLAEFHYQGGMHIVYLPLGESMQDTDEYIRLNTVVLPRIMNKIIELLDPIRLEKIKNQDIFEKKMAYQVELMEANEKLKEIVKIVDNVRAKQDKLIEAVEKKSS